MKTFIIPSKPHRETPVPRFSMEFVKADSFGIVPGSGWVIKENGKRLDWPMLTTREEAAVDLVEFQREFRQLASDEASERLGLSRMNGEME